MGSSLASGFAAAALARPGTFRKLILVSPVIHLREEPDSNGIVGSPPDERYRTLLPRAQIVHIDGSGHVPEVEKPEDLAKTVENFFERDRLSRA